MEEMKDTVVQESVTNQPEPSQTAPSQTEPAQSEPSVEPSLDKASVNFAMMRKKYESEENARKQAEQKAIELERKLQSYQQPSAPDHDDEDTSPDDEFVVNKNLKKTTKKITGKLSETEKKLQLLEQRLAHYEARSAMDSIKDFKDVVTDENLKTFAMLYPDEYETVMAHPNPQAKVKVAYNMIKNYGIAQAAPLVNQTQQIKAAEKKIEANKSKPGVAASAPVSNSPLTKLGRYNEEGRLILTDEDRDRINAETRRKLGMGL